MTKILKKETRGFIDNMMDGPALWLDMGMSDNMFAA